jgi:hypothetical protein
MKIFGFNITKDTKKKSFWTHMALVSTKRGRKILYLNGKECKIKNFTIECWTPDESIAKLDQLTYAKQIKSQEK